MLIQKKLFLAGLLAVGIVALACGRSDGERSAIADESRGSPNETIAAVPPTPVATPSPEAIVAPTPVATPSPEAIVAPTPVATPSPEAIVAPTPTLAEKIIRDPDVLAKLDTTPERIPSPKPPAADEVPRRLSFGWKTDFSKHSVPFSEIRSGGPPRDGIPPIDSPKFEDVAGNPDFLRDDESVISLEINGDARAYPLAILIWHEIVNDEVGGVPVTVTYCPLCNTAIVFDRRVNGQLLDFGTTGKLRNSDLVMWDRQTESWWQQITGEAIVGSMTGTKLKFIPAQLVSWSDFRDSFADGQVLSRDTGFARDYYLAPYGGYDQPGGRPFLFDGRIDNSLPAMERVVGLTVGDESFAYPFALFESVPVVNDTIGGQDIAIFYADDTLSAFSGSRDGSHRQVGSTGVFDPNLLGQKLTFRVDADRIVDDQTGSTWNILGRAVDGPLQGSELEKLVYANHFWFAWQAFYPESEIRIEEALAAN